LSSSLSRLVVPFALPAALGTEELPTVALVGGCASQTCCVRLRLLTWLVHESRQRMGKDRPRQPLAQPNLRSRDSSRLKRGTVESFYLACSTNSSIFFAVEKAGVEALPIAAEAFVLSEQPCRYVFFYLFGKGYCSRLPAGPWSMPPPKRPAWSIACAAWLLGPAAPKPSPP
jgi:hypothetical protein